MLLHYDPAIKIFVNLLKSTQSNYTKRRSHMHSYHHIHTTNPIIFLNSTGFDIRHEGRSQTNPLTQIRENVLFLFQRPKEPKTYLCVSDD